VLKLDREAGGVPLELTDVFQTSAREPGTSPPKVVLHLSPDMSNAAREETQLVLRSEGFELVSSNLASSRVAESQVFFFHEEDASSAARVAETIGARVRDFSSFRPAPERGRLEVWLAQDE
jgi:hypothetical protein